jgi:transposase-like protein
MVKRSKAETEKFYRRLVAEQEESGLSIRAFAATHGIPPGTLSSWRHELKERDAARARRGDKATKPRFVRVNVVGAGAGAGPGTPEPAPLAKPAGARAAVYEVVLGRDRVLRLPADFDEARVAALVRAVASC